MAFQAEFKPVGENKFYENGMVFATEKEAKIYGERKFSSWFGAEEFQVVETDREVTYKINLETREMSGV